MAREHLDFVTCKGHRSGCFDRLIKHVAESFLSLLLVSLVQYTILSVQNADCIWTILTRAVYSMYVLRD